MPPRYLGWLVFWISIAAYVPLIIGGWLHPIETNVACFTIWILLSLMLFYSARVQKLPGWRMNLAFFLGNILTVAIALMRGGYTFNLGPQETIGLYGIVCTVCVWLAVGAKTKRWDPNILYLGGIFVDVLSFYPVFKQYLMAHERATALGIAAWSMFGIGAFVNIVFVEQLFTRLRLDPLTYGMTFDEKKSVAKIFNASAFSLENLTLIVITTALMSR